MFDNATLAPDGTAYVDVGASRLSEIGIEIDEAGNVWRLVKEGETLPPGAVQIKGKYFVKVDPGDVGIRSITPAEIPLDIDVTRKRMGEIDEILRPTVTDEEQIAGRLAGVTGQEPPTTAAKVAAEIPEETRVALEAEREALRLQLEGTETTARMALTAPFDEGAPSQARFAHETRSAAYDALGRVSSGLSDNWGDLRRVTLTPVQEKEMAAWTGAMRERMSVARGVAVGTADNARDFILHDYPKRYGIDTLLGYLYPYQFWYSRTYVKWMKRLISNPALIGRYAKYRQYLEKQHAGLPDWWKYQLNTNELLGLKSEHPLWFNLEQTLSPLYGMTNIDFTDPRKREDWWSSTMEDLNKFGPSVWTPYQLALATAYHVQGKDEAASRWAGRLFSGTRFVRDATAMMGFNEGQGLELDPFIHLYSGGLGPYERARIGRTLSGMVGDGKYSEAEIIDASHSQVGPIWDEAVARAINERAPGNVASFFLGAGFKPRSQNDIQIDRFYSEMYGLIAQRDNYSPDEYSDGWDELRARYPFMDALLLSRKGGLERDEALARNTLSRIPPGATNSIAAMVDIDPDDLGAFYDNKGNLADMPESDRMRFMAAIIDISAILEVPSNATKSEWNAARDLRRDMLAQGEQMFGGDIWDRVDVFYAKDPEERDAYIKAMPIVEQAMDWQQQMIMSNPFMAAYYTSPERIEKYFKGEMYDEAEEKFGDDLWDHFEVHSRLSDIDNAAARQYWKDHPQLEEYIEFRDAELVEIGKRVDAIGSKIPEAAPPEFREGKVPEGGYQPVDDNEAWIRGQVLSYLGDWEPEAAKEQAQMPPGLNELLSAPGGRELYGLLLDAYYGEELPEIAKRRLEALGISEDYFNQ